MLWSSTLPLIWGEFHPQLLWVQQGDLLSPLGFSLALHPLVEKIRTQVPGLVINTWYLDDGTLCGLARDLCSTLAIIKEDGPARGFHLNRVKSLLHIPEGSLPIPNPPPPDIPISEEGFVLLGSPIGPASFCESTFLRRVRKVEAALAHLPDLKDSQMETTLLRSCLSFQKVAFALHTCPPSHINGATKAFDAVMREALSDLAGGPLSDWSWMKATLPSSLGSLNVWVASLHAPAAFIGSLNKSRTLVAMILGYTPRDSSHAASSLDTLANSAGKPAGVLWRMWMSLSIRRPSPMPLIGLLLIISFLWLQTPIPRPWLSPLLSLTLGTGSRLSLPSPLVSIFLIGSSVRVFNTGWGSLCWRRGFGARCVSHRPICMVITRLVVGEMGTESIGITPTGTHYILQLNWLLWRPGRKCLL